MTTKSALWWNKFWSTLSLSYLILLSYLGDMIKASELSVQSSICLCVNTINAGGLSSQTVLKLLVLLEQIVQWETKCVTQANLSSCRINRKRASKLLVSLRGGVLGYGAKEVGRRERRGGGQVCHNLKRPVFAFLGFPFPIVCYIGFCAGLQRLRLFSLLLSHNYISM